MARPFFIPEDGEAAVSQSSDSQATSPTSTTTTSPVSIPQSGASSVAQSPVNGEHLVQAIYEALYRYSRGGWWRSFIC